MSQVDIVHLEPYRKRRSARFRHTLALHAHEPEREQVLEHLWRALGLTGADRGAVVWVDEYGPGLVHPHTLLDLGADRPRRTFPPALLKATWETSVPGLLDLSGARNRQQFLKEGVASFCAIALGSDGPRSWFLVLDSLTPRPPLPEKVTGPLMFLAGEVASVVLHDDLTRPRRGVEARPRVGQQRLLSDSLNSPRNGSFAGWLVLEDLEGMGGEEATAIKIRNRFLVARLLRGLLEDHLVVDEDSLSHQVRGVLKEIAQEGDASGEARVWQRILAAVQEREYVELVAGILEWGRMAEAEGHSNGALEIFELAFELARTSGASGAAADAARFQGKVYRSRAQWDQALFWYGVARRISEESGNRKRLAMVLDGLGNAYRDLGNLPRARETLLEVLEIGRSTGDRSVLAVGHHDLMTVEKLRGDLVEAIHQGWLAVQAYDSRDGRLRALFDLASTLREGGELSAARDAYGLVADQVKGLEARILALDALAFLAALRGNVEEHATLRKRMDAEGWETVPPVYRGQILYYRGLSHRALGQEATARVWLERALAYAGDRGLNKLIFDAEAALAEDRPGEGEDLVAAGYEDSVPEEILGVRRGLRAMKEAPAGLG